MASSLMVQKAGMSGSPTPKEIMSFCKLNWSKKVLKYYERKDLICTTASNIQIREKIFKYESDKFLPYKEYFDNFK